MSVQPESWTVVEALLSWWSGQWPWWRYVQVLALGWKTRFPRGLINLLVTGAVVVARAG